MPPSKPHITPAWVSALLTVEARVGMIHPLTPLTCCGADACFDMLVAQVHLDHGRSASAWTHIQAAYATLDGEVQRRVPGIYCMYIFMYVCVYTSIMVHVLLGWHYTSLSVRNRSYYTWY